MVSIPLSDFQLHPISLSLFKNKDISSSYRMYKMRFQNSASVAELYWLKSFDRVQEQKDRRNRFVLAAKTTVTAPLLKYGSINGVIETSLNWSVLTDDP
ncbi:hypothetical protein AYI68_g7082 [Smittium mucronatum]|uniref:Uncharacterized protein n=1 Tax=Smittium mucronatum TaxID=133383 RepID=A0A1R0GPP4_9FUNG|nr:hypothetical protein AYI68_g7082 [Smittium mucronatum]